jgi:hypothetical protein
MKKKKNMPAIEREESKTPRTRQCKWITLIYFILPCRDKCSKAQGGSVDPLNFKKSCFRLNYIRLVNEFGPNKLLQSDY